jgi:hypothetical protein
MQFLTRLAAKPSNKPTKNRAFLEATPCPVPVPEFQKPKSKKHQESKKP